jgi:type II secretory pathway pseudopilin PulG
MNRLAKRKATLAKALISGINTARSQIDELRLEQRDSPLERRKAIIVELETWDAWVLELAEALHWLDGAELQDMRQLHHGGRP